MAEHIDGAVIVIAKTPVPGRVKTRLCPPLTEEQACDVAWACLLDTLDAVAAVPARRHVLLLDGEPGPWVPSGFEIIEQRGDGLAERLANGFADVADTAVLVAMDTPHVEPALVSGALGAVARTHEAAFGPAVDGGYWLIGLRAGVRIGEVFHAVPMSVPETGTIQLDRLWRLGLRTFMLPELADVDTYEDLVSVAHVGRLAGLLSAAGPQNPAST